MADKRPSDPLEEIGNASSDPLDFDDGVDALADILDPDVLDREDAQDVEPTEDDIDDDQEDTDEPTDELEDEEDTEVDDDEDEVEDDADDDDEDEDEEEPDAVLDAEVTMEDGRSVKVRDLQGLVQERVKDVERHFSQRTEELNSLQGEVAQERQLIGQAAIALKEHRDLLTLAYEQFRPKEPDPALMDYDITAYSKQKAAYDNQMRIWDGIQRQSQELSQKEKDRKASEDKQANTAARQRMLEVDPKLADKEYLQKFSARTDKYLTSMGAPEGAITELGDAWQLKILRDAMAYRDLTAKKAPKTKEKLKGKPKILKGKRRVSSKEADRRNRKVNADRLRKTGSLEDGVAALMDFDL